MVTILSWNVNGIRAVLQKDFLGFIKKYNPDMLCIQETKAHPDQVDTQLHDYPYHYWNTAEKKGYSGTVIFCKEKPLSVHLGMGVKQHDTEGRVVTLDFEKYYLVNVYVPNSGRGLPRLKYREQWDKDFLHYLLSLEKKKPIVVCGDFNVAHTAIDLANPDENYNKVAGYTQVEIEGFEHFLQKGFIDIFREFNKKPGQYTYWGYWNNLRKRNVGWRIDYFLVSSSLRKQVKEAFILPAVMGSDHCPVGLKLSF